MRLLGPICSLVLVASTAWAACVDCVPGGGPAATDCFVEWSGMPADMQLSCTDGASTDADGAFDGACSLDVHVCVNVEGLPGCTPQTLTRTPSVKPTAKTAAAQLASALGQLALSGEQCTDARLSFETASKKGTKVRRMTLKVKAQAGALNDADKLHVEARPALLFTPPPGAPAPTLSADVQPIFTARCAIPACHSGPSPSAGQSLEVGQSWATDVNQPSTNQHKFLRVVPGNVAASYLARKILGEGILDPTAVMPQGCPGFPPSGGCLTDAEKATILSWIAAGAPDN